ncbi:hypothetical protein BCR37DRAFT_412452 [Protomyces lactucae-debilis]|uniref:Rho GTPase activation protein n=1 Tax=Protomyces lactucae-debilis TaxID=2754530 RepID=A0A1Y2FN40_PROLT|nr:uncharacterized protein BCR37DRAFT_412452 [Protomyces lactucae-debilis]ORY84764.1 hypothetical protein BCR37DRAFT_412452 [Protomyces lactucae-debilis]
MPSSKSRKDLTSSSLDEKAASGSGGFTSFFGRKRRVATGSPEPSSSSGSVRDSLAVPGASLSISSSPLRTSLASRQYKALSRSMNDLTQLVSRDDVLEDKTLRPVEETPFAGHTITKSGWVNRKSSKKEAQWKLSRIYLRESKLYFFKPPSDVPFRAFDVHMSQRSGLSAALMGTQEEQLHPADFDESVRNILFDLKSTTPQRFSSSHRLQEEGSPRIAFIVDGELLLCHKAVHKRLEGWTLETRMSVLHCEASIYSTGFDELLQLRYADLTRRFKYLNPTQFINEFEQAIRQSSRPATAPMLLSPKEGLFFEDGTLVSGTPTALCKHILEHPDNPQSTLLLQTMGFWHPVQDILAEFRKHMTSSPAALVQGILKFASSVLLDAPCVEGILKLIERCEPSQKTALVDDLWKRRANLLSVISMESAECQADAADLQEGLTISVVLSLNPSIFATQLHLFHRFFFEAWNPSSDESLFFAQLTRNPLLFSARQMHFITFIVLQQLLDPLIDTEQRAALCMQWIKIALASKKAGDMTGWLAVVMAICAPSVARLTQMWTQMDARVRMTVEREWGSVVRDLFRRTLGGTLADMASAHVLAPSAANTTAAAHEIVPFYGDLCDAVDKIRDEAKGEHVQLDQVAAAYEAVTDALDNWQVFQDEVALKASTPRLASFQECFKRLNTLPMETRDLCSPALLDTSFLCEPNLAIDDLHERKTLCELRPGTAAFLPLLFTDLLPTYRLFDPSDLLQFSDPTRKLPSKATGLRRLNSFPPTQRAGHYTTGLDALDETTRARHAASNSDWKMLRHLKDLTGVQDNQLTASDDSFILRNAAQGKRAAKVRPQSIIMETRKRDSIISRRSSLLMEEEPGSRPGSKRGQRECVVKAASLAMLVDLAVSDLTNLKDVTLLPLIGPAINLDQIYLDRAEYIKMLLASMRSYCAPHEFMQQLTARASLHPVGVFQVLTSWQTHFASDFFSTAVQDAFVPLLAALPADDAKELRRQLLKIHHTPSAWPWLEPAEAPFHITFESSSDDAARVLTALDSLIEAVLETATLGDWMRYYELLEFESLDPKAFFMPLDYTGSHDLQIADCASLLQHLNKSGTEEPLVNFFPSPIRVLFDVHMHMRDWVVAQVTDPTIEPALRSNRITFFLQMLAISGARMRPFDIVSGTEEQKIQIVPSFAASAIAAGLVHPTSRAFSLAWSQISETLGNGDYCGSIMELVSRVQVEITDGPLVPCTCWLTERMLEIACCLPDTLITSPHLLNFDKRQYIYNLLANLDLLGPFTSRPDTGNDFRFLLVPVESHELRAVRDAANKENQQKRLHRVFGNLIVFEQEKIRRDLKQREIVERLLKESRRAAQRKQMELQRSLEASRRPSATRSRYGMNSLLRAVRPLSVAITGSWAEKMPIVRTVPPAELPETCSIREGTKPVLTADLVKAHIRLISKYDFTFMIRSEDGIETYVQAPTLHEAEEWVKRLTWASIDGARKRQSMMLEDRKRPFEVPQFSPRNSQVLNVSTAMFGVNLDVLCAREDCSIPRIALQLMDAIERKGLDEVGIYRISGSLATVNRLKQCFDTGRPVELENEQWSDIHAIAGAFKLWLRELPEPVMTYDLYADFLATVDIKDPTGKHAKLRDLIYKLPAPNFALLRRLLEHLQKITDYESTNHMYAHNLAIVFGPNVLQPVPSAMSFANSMNDLGKVQTVMRNLILQYHDVFGAADEEIEDVTDEEARSLTSSSGSNLLPAILEG